MSGFDNGKNLTSAFSDEAPAGGHTHLGKTTGGIVGYNNGGQGGRTSMGRYNVTPEGKKQYIWQPS